jgi:hypothetical protein
MQTYKFSAVMAAVVAAAIVAFATAPSEAQTTSVQARQGPIRVATAGRPPARVTVRKRSYLDPGTEAKRHTEHYADYAYPPGGSGPYRNSTLFHSGPGLPFTHDRMPFPNCFDLPGFCQ